MFLCITTFLVLIIMLYAVSARPETFTNMPLLVLTVTRSPHDIVISNADDTDLTILKDVDHIIKESNCKGCVIHVRDFYEVMKRHESMRLLGVLPTERSFVFVKEKNLNPWETVGDVFKAGKDIGYFEDHHYDILKRLSHCYGQREPVLKKVKEGGVMSTYAVFYLREVEHRPIHLGEGIVPDVFDLGDININLLKTFLPYALIKNKDFKKYVRGYLDRYTTKTCLVFENLLVGDGDFDAKSYDPIIKDIQKTLRDTPKRNFYSMFADKVEGFEQEPSRLDLEPKANVSGFYEAARGVFTVFNNVIDNVRVRPLDHVVLRQQERNEENGSYVVQVVKERYVLLEKDTPLIKETAEQLSKYLCVGDPSKKNVLSCEQNQRNVWDRPCEENTECPFYQLNKNYMNYRGGCLDGKCELPVGVTAKGFRGYDPASKPICYGCSIEDPSCCYTQDSPDYVFAMDSSERLHGMGTEGAWHWDS